MVGLLEERERGARERVEVLREEADRVLAEARDAELFWERFVTAREVLVEVLAGPGGGGAREDAGAGCGKHCADAEGREVPGPVVPVRG